MVSIIIATYNSEKTLRRAMLSVLNLTYQDWECIVVDGASKDGTLAIVKKFAAKDSRFRYISEPDHGIYDAFNKGWRMAKGEWIMYLGSDDEFTPDGIKTLVGNAQDADVVFGDTWLLNTVTGKKKLQQSSIGDSYISCCSQSMMMKKELIDRLGGFNEQYRALADADLNYKAMKANCKVVQVKSPISIFSIGGVSQRFSWANRWESFQIQRKYRSLGESLNALVVSTLKLYLIDILRRLGLK